MNLNEILKSNFHFIIFPKNEIFKKELIKEIKEKKFEINIFQSENLDIDTARKIKKINSIKSPKKRFIILDYNLFYPESQNALLKTFEESEENTFFILFLENKNEILKTIKSRAFIFQKNNKNFFKNKKAIIFLETENFSEKEKIIEKIDKEEVQDFLNTIEKVYFNKNKNLEKYQKFLEMKKISQKKGSDLKKILTFLAIYF